MFIRQKNKKIRKYNGITGKELSVILGISQQQLSRYENGISLPPIDKLYIFCDIFDITISQFFDSRLDDRAKNYSAKSVGGRSILSSGISAYFNYDSRDFLPNARQGQALEIIYSYFSPELASNNRFQSTQLQYSVYYSLSENNVLAIDNYARFTSGSVLWDHLSLLGNANQMRGYYEGRYRDNNVFTTQLEYRRKLDCDTGLLVGLELERLVIHHQN